LRIASYQSAELFMGKILVATHNKGKLKEFRDAFQPINVDVVDLSSFPDVAEVEETGIDFSENARLKAIYYSQKTGLAAVADDSGLEVEALNGAPGVLSARYGGIGATDLDRIDKLLSELINVPEGARAARFVCSLAVADHHGAIVWEGSGFCNGRIAFFPRGSNGFGYDPVFVPEGFEETFGELPETIKQRISHRARAIAKLEEYLKEERPFES
jgi:XTP/dITP diphosphohydrolase